MELFWVPPAFAEATARQAAWYKPCLFRPSTIVSHGFFEAVAPGTRHPARFELRLPPMTSRYPIEPFTSNINPRPQRARPKTGTHPTATAWDDTTGRRACNCVANGTPSQDRRRGVDRSLPIASAGIGATDIQESTYDNRQWTFVNALDFGGALGSYGVNE